MEIGGEKKRFMLDTGASLFPLIMYQDDWDEYRKLDSEIDTL